MRAGLLRHSITIQTPTDAQSSTGGVSQTWATYATRRARVEPMDGREGFRADEYHGEAPFRFTIRYTSGVTKKMRVSWDSRTFDITSVSDILDPQAGARMTVILATEDD